MRDNAESAQLLLDKAGGSSGEENVGGLGNYCDSGCSDTSTSDTLPYICLSSAIEGGGLGSAVPTPMSPQQDLVFPLTTRICTQAKHTQLQKSTRVSHNAPYQTRNALSNSVGSVKLTGKDLSEETAISCSSETATTPTSAGGTSASDSAIVLTRLNEVVEEMKVGCAQLPTIGSASHHQGGKCKPCAYGAKRCRNGIHCDFCHLCEPAVNTKKGRWILKRRRNAQELYTDFLNLQLALDTPEAKAQVILGES
jgi:hypothetical protein